MKLFIIILATSLLFGCASKTLDPVEEQKKIAEKIERCKKLKREIDSLKGKPVRRNAAIEYFNDECGYKPEPGKF